jgi:hypothetical protein
MIPLPEWSYFSIEGTWYSMGNTTTVGTIAGTNTTLSMPTTTITSCMTATYTFHLYDSGPQWIDMGYIVDQGTGEIAPHGETSAWRREHERSQHDRQQAQQARASAQNRGEALLLALLGDEQRSSYRERGSFAVVGSAGGRYLINKGVAGNVQWLDDGGQVGGALCAHPDMHESWLPHADVAIAQMLALLTDEPAFLDVANVYSGDPPPMLAALAGAPQ